MQECWLNGVSTRKIENIAKRLGIESLSASEVSEINSGLDQMVDEFRTRRLDAEYPVIWADALYEKIRDNHRVVSKAVMVVKAVNLEGRQEILAIEPMENESEETYSALFRRLQERGLEKVWCAFPTRTGGCRRQYAAPSMEPAGRGARCISCGIYLPMFHKGTRRGSPQD